LERGGTVMNIYSGITAVTLLGSSSSTGLDSALLSNYYSAQLQAASVQSSASGASSSSTSSASMPTDQISVPPWDPSKDTTTDAQKLSDAQTTDTFVTKVGNYFNNFATPDDLEKLFTAYQALSKLDALATSAASDGTVSGARLGLDKQFQKGFGQLNDFLSGQTFDKLTLIEGQKLPTTKSTLAVPRTILSQYTGTAVVNGQYTDPVTLSGDQKFTVQVKKSGNTIAVPIDLSLMTGPATLDNIASYINSALSANGIVSRVARNEVAEGKFGLVVNGTETETLSFLAPTGTPALYVAGTSGTGSNTAGLLTRIDDDGTSGSMVFGKRIEGVESTSTTTTTVKDATSATGSTTATVTNNVLAPTSAKSTAVDADGHVYVVGSTQGAVNGEQIQGTQDAYLTKYDSTGHVLWTRLLGATSNADGFAVATDSKGNVVVAGRVDAPLTQSAVGGKLDSFVTKYNAEGEEIFTRQTDPLSDDGATALAIGPDDSIYVGGYAKSAISASASYAGSGDATLTKLSPTGTRIFSQEFGTAGSDTTRGVAIAADGNVLVASVENDHAVLRKFDSATGASTPLWTVDLGALQGGDIGALTVSGNAVYIGGSTSNAALTGGGAASIVHASSGGKDGFVAKVTDNGASAAQGYVSYIGSGASDAVRGITTANGAVYVTGDTQGALPGQMQSGTTNGFAAKLDASGAISWIQQYSGQAGIAAGASIAVAAKGSSVLDQLGLPTGTFDFSTSQLLTANSTLRAGATFGISVNGKPARTVTIAADDTIQSLKTRINAILLQAGKASSSYSSAGYQLQMTVNSGNSVEFLPGKDGFDALKGLGIQAGSIVNETKGADTDTPSTTIAPADLTPQNNYVALGMDKTMSLTTKDAASKAQTQIESAMRNNRLAYTTLTQGKFIAGTGKYAQQQSAGAAPAYLQNQIASYKAALARLQSGTSSGALFGF
jgi:hypothetical protein